MQQRSQKTDEQIAELVSARLRGEVVVKVSYSHNHMWHDTYMAVSLSWISTPRAVFRTNNWEPLVKRGLLKNAFFSYEGVLWAISDHAKYDAFVMLYVNRLP